MKSGIYEITHEPTGKRYIGQSKNITSRWASHIEGLVEGSHHNYKMATLYKRGGITAFTFRVIEYCPESRLDEREALWISKRGDLNIKRPALKQSSAWGFFWNCVLAVLAAMVILSFLKGL